ncbi:MAG: (Fe-S)-binding protein, partial [Desulfobacterales bacterium]|nr:(Fe-S)-binding protein [Desulfobacterales bacterium]
MTDMNALAESIRELDDLLAVCMRCGMCQAACPLFARTGRESDVARGKLALLDGLMKQMFQDPDGVNERLNKCLLCGSCAANCPSGVNVLEIFIKARGVLTGYKGLSPAKRIALRGMLARPGFFDRCMEWAAKIQEPFTKTVNPTVGASCARIGSPLLSGRHFKPLAKVPFHKQIS